MWAVAVCGALTAVLAVWMLCSRAVWDAKGKVREMLMQRVLITGGSQGLGLALAQRLASKGAHVVICSRSAPKLERALAEVEAAHVDRAQELRYVVADVSTMRGAAEAVAQCGAVPDAVFCCAGGAKPGFFVEQEERDFEAAVRTDYFTALWTAHVRVRADAGECEGDDCGRRAWAHCAGELRGGPDGPRGVRAVCADEVCDPGARRVPPLRVCAVWHCGAVLLPRDDSLARL